MATRPTPGTVRARREIPEIGVTVLTMSNGVEVWLKPTDFRNDQVLFTAYSRGGTSLASQADYHNASLSTSLVGLAGLGGFNPVDLGKLTAGKIANAGSYMSAYTHGISGNATPRDLETALQLTHLLFTAPNKDMDAEAFLLMRRRLEAALANQAQNPGSVFGERVRAINTMDHYAARSLKLEDLPKLDPRADAGLFRRAFRQRRRLHVLLRRRVQGGRDHAAADHLPRVAAVARHGDRDLRRRPDAVPRFRDSRDRRSRARSRGARRS